MKRIFVSSIAFLSVALYVPVSGQTGIITTAAGDGPSCVFPNLCGGFSGDGGLATSASLYYPIAVAVDSSGNLFIADTYNLRIRKVSAGLITTVAGSGGFGFAGDGGPATLASLSGSDAIAVDASGNLFILDNNNGRIRMVSAKSGTITTVAGGGTAGLGDGGPATSATLSQPSGLAVDASGNIFIADQANNRVRKVSNGMITTFAGNGIKGFSGDGGPATLASLNDPSSLAVDASGNLFIADGGNGRVRTVSQSGIITTIAGGGSSRGDGVPATSASLSPFSIALDSSGNLFVNDTVSGRIRMVSASGIISNFAGNGTSGFSGDGGPASLLSLNSPGGLALDTSGNLFIADARNNRVREVLAVAPSPTVPITGITNGAGFSARISGGAIGTIFGTNVALATTSASSTPLPTTLSGSTVTMNGVAVPLFFVSPYQINFQIPWQLMTSATAALTVTTAGGTSAPVTASLSLAAPGIFTIVTPNSATQGAIQIANTTTLVAPVGAIPGATSRPAMAGDVLTIYCSGLGAVNNTPDSGSTTTGSSSTVQAQVSVTVGGKSAPVSFAGLVPTYVGLYQVNAQLPTGVTAGNAVPVIVTTASLSSNTATIAVQ